MRFLFLRFLPLLLASVLPAAAQNAEQIMERARLAATLQHNELDGTIQTGGSKVPVKIYLKGKNIQFLYSPDRQSWKRFHMRLSDDKYDLFEIRDEKTYRFDPGKLSQSLAGSHLTFEDLALRFFYWPNPQLLGDERVKTFDCWKVRIDNPGTSGAYRAVYVWIHKEYGAFMKVEGFDRNGNKLKQFTVEDVMKLSDGSYTLQRMKVSGYRGGRATGISYLEFDKPKKGPGGMR